MIQIRETQGGKYVFDVYSTSGHKLATSSTRYGSLVGAFNGAGRLLKALNGEVEIKSENIFGS